MPLLIKKTKYGLKAALKASGYKLPHGYDIKKRKNVNKKKTKTKKY
jgi:hypothetical protein